ncbi:tripartite motif-containing protein 2-like [Gigantopelta aegis]|uniref:tripartite motif-containing protein 2-like n=1 Tax=Gigantopelta aegis TaxID=1735272 RepID=UPI001B88CF9B|nr:tripartite motif-containing protein 2-like [Gigantopelta aegis]
MSETSTPDDVIKRCLLCHEDLYEPQILPCLHILCINCVQRQNSRSKAKFACPLCNFSTPSDKATQPYRCCNFAKLHLKQNKEREQENNGRHLVWDNGSEEDGSPDESEAAEQNGDEDDDDEDQDDQDIVCPSEDACAMNTNGDEESKRKNSIEFRLPCAFHQQYEANMFCKSCHSPVCDKCLKTLHKRCKGHSSLEDAVEAKRTNLDQIHERMTVLSLSLQNQLRTKQQQMVDIQQEKEEVEREIASFRQEVMTAVHAQERMLLDELNDLYNIELVKLNEQQAHDTHGLSCLCQSIDVFESALSMGAEGEILEDLPLIEKRVNLYEKDLTDTASCSNKLHITFDPNRKILDSFTSLGKVNLFYGENGNAANVEGTAVSDGDVWNSTFRLMMSYHGSTRDDTTHPLLTDAVILANDDVILTDRDNKSLKKFNSDGKLLTRVDIPEVPSRLAIVSGSKIVVSVMNKRELLFLSLHGTLRVLSKSRTAKQYSFVSGTGDGLLVVSTSNCDSIDIISQKGKFLRTLYTQKSEKAVLSRPIYLHSTTRGTILISDSSRKCLLAVTSEGDKLFTYRSNDAHPMECPLGVTCDPSGHILLADRDTNKIHLLSPSGNFLKIVSSEELSVEKPCALNFYKGERLVITQVDGTIKVFSCIKHG